mgnify:CR=1 FL=1
MDFKYYRWSLLHIIGLALLLGGLAIALWLDYRTLAFVLCGLLAGFWAQLGLAEGFNFASAQKAAACAVYLHGLSGDLAAVDLTDYCVMAGELLDYLPDAINQVLK